MARDVRLKGPAFNALVVILAGAFPHPQRIETIATQLDTEGKAALAGNAHDQWTSLLKYAGDHSGKLDELLDLIDYYIKTTTYYDEFLSWRGQGSHAKLDRAVSDLQKSRSALLRPSDPRKAQYISAMRSSIMDIKEMIEAAPGKETSGPNILTATTEEAAGARGKILDACGDALKAVDQLIIDTAEAEQRSASIEREYGVLEASIVGPSVTRHLLEDRGRVDRRSLILLQVIEKQLAHLEIAVLDSDQE